MQKYAEQLKQIEKQLIGVALLDAPASVMAGLGIYGKVAEDAGAMVPFLGNPDIVNLLLAVGLATMGMCAWRFFKLLIQRSRLLQDGE